MGGATVGLSVYELSKLVKNVLIKTKTAKLIFVVSAFAGITRILDSIFIAMVQKNQGGVDSLFSIFKEIHFNRMRELRIENSEEIENIFSQIDLFIHKDHLSGNKTIDQAHLLSFGEILSSLIFNHFISKMTKEEIILINARSLFISKPHGSSYVEARIELVPTIENINLFFNMDRKHRVFITQGFISSDGDLGRASVLGYDGSDLSAAVIALSLVKSKNFVDLTFWKDVLGVLKDLKYPDSIFPVMRTIEYIEYSILNSVPVRSDSIKLFFNIDPEIRGKYLGINIRSSINIDCLGTILKP